jgi:hypothetical protein
LPVSNNRSPGDISIWLRSCTENERACVGLTMRHADNSTDPSSALQSIAKAYGARKCLQVPSLRFVSYPRELNEYLKPLFGRLPQRLNRISVFSLRLPLYAIERNAFHMRFPLQNAQGVRCFDALDLPGIAGKEYACALSLCQLEQFFHLPT